MQQAINKNVQQKLPTYKRVLTDHHSKNLELWSHLLVVACMSRIESTRLLHKDPPKLGKVCADLSHLDLLQYEISHLKAL
jgi:hypothetical protein